MKLISIGAICLAAIVAARVFGAPKASRPSSRFSAAQVKAGQAEFMERSRAANSAQTKWIEKSLGRMNTIKTGMTRGQLLQVFTTEGGLSTRAQRTYVYRECPYIKVDVRFKPAGRSKYPHSESVRDVITQISRPYLAWMILD